MQVPKRRNPKKYKHRSYGPRVPKVSFPDTVMEQSEPEEPFSLDDPPHTFEDWLNEIQTLEDMLLADENERLLADSDYDDYEKI